MTSEEKDIQLIEDYLADKLSADELKQVSLRIDVDKDFQQLFDEISTVIDDVKSVSSKETMQFLQELDEEQFPKKAGKTAKLNQYYMVAATITFIVAAGLFWYRSTIPPVYEDLFAANFNAPANHVMPVVRGAETPEALKGKAYYAYDEGDYEGALSLFSKIPESDDDGAVLYYLGISYLANEEPGMAIKKLQSYLAEYGDLKEDATWYLFLGYVANGSKESAKQLFNEASSSGIYKAKMDDVITAWEQAE